MPEEVAGTRYTPVNAKSMGKEYREGKFSNKPRYKSNNKQ